MSSSAAAGGFEHDSFGGERLRRLFVELDTELAAESLSGPCRIVILGGAAIALRVPGRVTGDVDVVSEGLPPALRRAAERVASRHNLRPDWINDAAKLKTVSISADSEPVFEGARLIVESASPRYILAMKLVSARPVDKPDCVALVRELGINDIDALLDLIESAVPWGPHRTVTTRYFAEEVLTEAIEGRDERSGLWQRMRDRLRQRRRARSNSRFATESNGPSSPTIIPRIDPIDTGLCPKRVRSNGRPCILKRGHKGRCRSRTGRR